MIYFEIVILEFGDRLSLNSDILFLGHREIPIITEICDYNFV